MFHSCVGPLAFLASVAGDAATERPGTDEGEGVHGVSRNLRFMKASKEDRRRVAMMISHRRKVQEEMRKKKVDAARRDRILLSRKYRFAPCLIFGMSGMHRH